MVGEAEIMSYARSHGVPVPEVFDAGDGYIVMERVDGSAMIDAALPFGIRRYGRVLAELHHQVHELVAPPDLLRSAPVPGDRLVHGDLHPLNVMITDGGPVVIDWANAMAGDPSFDVADTWVVLASATPPPQPLQRLAAAVGRRSFIGAFLGEVDVHAARRALPAAVANRVEDPNMSAAERERMLRLLGRA